MVDDLNLAFPNPPFPPETTSKRSPSFFKSAISSSVDSSKTTVPTGTFKIMSLASLPCLFLPSPGEPFLAWYFFCNLKSCSVVKELSALRKMLPPFPPSPPSGPPLGINYSLLKLKHPFPPEPAIN